MLQVLVGLGVGLRKISSVELTDTDDSSILSQKDKKMVAAMINGVAKASRQKDSTQPTVRFNGRSDDHVEMLT